MDTTPYTEETYIEISERLEIESPPPTQEVLDKILARYPVSITEEYNHYAPEWTETEPLYNPVTRTFTQVPTLPIDLENQHNCFVYMIDMLLKNNLTSYHTRHLIGMCSHVIESLSKGVHTEVVNDLVMLLAWKNQSVRQMLIEMEQFILNKACPLPYAVPWGTGISDNGTNRYLWITNLFERSFAGGDPYTDEIHEHIITRLALITFHLTRHARGAYKLLDACIGDVCVKLRKLNDSMINLEMSIAFDKAFEKESTSLLRDGECKWRTLATSVPPEKQPLHGYTCRKQLNMFGNCTENTIVQRMKIPLYDNFRKDQIGLIKKIHNIQKLCHPSLCD